LQPAEFKATLLQLAIIVVLLQDQFRNFVPPLVNRFFLTEGRIAERSKICVAAAARISKCIKTFQDFRADGVGRTRINKLQFVFLRDRIGGVY